MVSQLALQLLAQRRPQSGVAEHDTSQSLAQKAVHASVLAQRMSQPGVAPQSTSQMSSARQSQRPPSQCSLGPPADSSAQAPTSSASSHGKAAARDSGLATMAAAYDIRYVNSDVAESPHAVESNDLRVTVVRPKTAATEALLRDTLGGREWAYVIELSGLSVVWKTFGSFGASDNSSAKQGLAELIRQLG